MEHYVEIQFGRFTARVDENGNWIVSSSEPIDGGQTREILEVLEFASTGPYSDYAPNRAVRFAAAAVANLPFDAEITDNTYPTEPIIPGVAY